MIPEHLIDKFKDSFTQYPSIIEVCPEYIKTDLDKVFKRSRLLWVSEEIKSDGSVRKDSSLYEYDPTGILVYINSENRLFILTTIERKGVADYMINSLKFK
jgi:hypothetical protein